MPNAPGLEPWLAIGYLTQQSPVDAQHKDWLVLRGATDDNQAANQVLADVTSLYLMVRWPNPERVFGHYQRTLSGFQAQAQT